MSLNLRSLSILGYANGMTHWAYKTSDTRRDLEGTSYWKDAENNLNLGDFIFVHHINRGNAIYCVAQDGRVRCMVEHPPRVEELL